MNLLSPLKQAFRPKAAPSDCFDQPFMQGFDRREFTQRQPFPWYNFQSLLTAQAFEDLYREFPSLDFFETHEGMARKYGQRPHDRYYLAYEKTIYKDLDRSAQKGIIRQAQLLPSWQAFMSALQSDPGYRGFICDLLGVKDFTARYAWHVATAGRSVSPHVDARNKIGTHIFYFNTSEDWQAEWGGSTLVLGGKNYEGMNPEISDFSSVEAVAVMDNRSFLFKNQPEAWHAVDTINCPPGVHRRIFNVIFENAEPGKSRFFGR
jgi:hypothetical protein